MKKTVSMFNAIAEGIWNFAHVTSITAILLFWQSVSSQ